MKTPQTPLLVMPDDLGTLLYWARFKAGDVQNQIIDRVAHNIASTPPARTQEDDGAPVVEAHIGSRRHRMLDRLTVRYVNGEVGTLDFHQKFSRILARTQCDCHGCQFTS
jgi:hypothetical protein